MGRRIVVSQPHSAAAPESVDDYSARVVKYIPGDVLAVWVLLSGLIKSTPDMPGRLRWAVFAVPLVATPLWTHRQTRAEGRPPAWTQIAVSAIAFPVWAFALGPPFDQFSSYRPTYGSMLLGLFTLVTGLMLPRE